MLQLFGGPFFGFGGIGCEGDPVIGFSVAEEGEFNSFSGREVDFSFEDGARFQSYFQGCNIGLVIGGRDFKRCTKSDGTFLFQDNVTTVIRDGNCCLLNDAFQNLRQIGGDHTGDTGFIGPNFEEITSFERFFGRKVVKPQAEAPFVAVLFDFEQKCILSLFEENRNKITVNFESPHGGVVENLYAIHPEAGPIIRAQSNHLHASLIGLHFGIGIAADRIGFG